jgi:hypothetical protein
MTFPNTEELLTLLQQDAFHRGVQDFIGSLLEAIGNTQEQLAQGLPRDSTDYAAGVHDGVDLFANILGQIKERVAKQYEELSNELPTGKTDEAGN